MSNMVEMRVLPDEHGNVHAGCKVRIHYLVQQFDEGDPAEQIAKGFREVTRGYIACDPRIERLPKDMGALTKLVMHSGEPGAVTCPECLASKEWKDANENLRTLVNVAAQVS